ncbi:MAG: hypothetical protein WKF58_20085 [Ilumatobacteraceae bacterium]
MAGWGAKSASAVLGRYPHYEDIPESVGDWGLGGLRSAATLARTLRENWEHAVLFRRIATVECDVEVGTVDDWEWKGPTVEFSTWAQRLGVPELADAAAELATTR